MENSEKYKIISEEGFKLSSVMAVFASDPHFIFTEEYIQAALLYADEFTVKTFNVEVEETENLSGATLLVIETTIDYKDTTYEIVLTVNQASLLNLSAFTMGNQLEEDELDTAIAQKFYLECEVVFSDSALDSYHFQLKILHAIVPQASVVVDFMPYRLLSGKWLSLTAHSAIPPSPEYIYAIHAIYQGNKNEGPCRYWLHTHGLLRCGSVELEMIDLGEGAHEIYQLLNIAAKMQVEGKAIQEKEQFTAGYDGLEMKLCWIPWEEAVERVAETAAGGKNDRIGENNDHNEPSGVLFAVEEGQMISPEIYAETLSNDPLFFISTEETLRMAALAQDRFSQFSHCFEHYSHLQDWDFLIKVGIPVDQAKDENDREHLWFEVLSIDENKIEAALNNTPYWVKNMKQGDVMTIPLEMVTDWMIYSPLAHTGNYTPDTIYQLK